MELILIGALLAGLNLLALRHGNDSREQGDWQPMSGAAREPIRSW
jgi:hypothetical protein